MRLVPDVLVVSLQGSNSSSQSCCCCCCACIHNILDRIVIGGNVKNRRIACASIPPYTCNPCVYCKTSKAPQLRQQQQQQQRNHTGKSAPCRKIAHIFVQRWVGEKRQTTVNWGIGALSICAVRYRRMVPV